MDSDDEIMSDSPSADELDLDDGTQDSDIGSIAGGTRSLSTTAVMH
jgi:hypothetical protein